MANIHEQIDRRGAINYPETNDVLCQHITLKNRLSDYLLTLLAHYTQNPQEQLDTVKEESSQFSLPWLAWLFTGRGTRTPFAHPEQSDLTINRALFGYFVGNTTRPQVAQGMYIDVSRQFSKWLKTENNFWWGFKHQVIQTLTGEHVYPSVLPMLDRWFGSTINMLRHQTEMSSNGKLFRNNTHRYITQLYAATGDIPTVEFSVQIQNDGIQVVEEFDIPQRPVRDYASRNLPFRLEDIKNPQDREAVELLSLLCDTMGDPLVRTVVSQQSQLLSSFRSRGSKQFFMSG